MTDLTMQTVPGPAVVGSRDAIPEQELLPTTPNANISQLAAEVEVTQEQKKNKKKNKRRRDSSNSERELHGNSERGAWGLILEVILVTLLGFMPWFLAWLAFNYSEYDLTIVKGPQGLNYFHEFYRWTLFIIVSYDILILAELPFRPLPRLFLRIGRSFNPRLGQGKVLALACLRHSVPYWGLALAFMGILWLADAILYDPARNIATDQILALLNPVERLRAQELLIGDQAESTLAAFFLFALFMALEKYCVAAIRSSFHRVAIGPRAMHCNRKLQVLGAIYRNRQALTAASISTTSLGGQREDKDEYLMASRNDMDIGTMDKAKRLANVIFKSLCPADRDVITAAEFKGYFPPGEHEMAFHVFDPNRRGELSRSEFVGAVLDVYQERNNLAMAIVSNDHIVEKLDWTLLFIFGLIGLLFALVVWNHRGYGWVTSMGTFILGFSFLFRSTLEKIFNTFLFVFVEHAYDVSDRVIIGDENLLVNDVEIFTTHFIRSDGVVVYSPNANLRSRTIYNQQRITCEKDELVIKVNAGTDIKKLAELRTRLTNYLTETENEFTGTVTVNIVKFEGNGADRRAKVKIETKFRPKTDGLKSDLALHTRRQKALAAFKNICTELDLDYELYDFDE